LQSVDLSDNKWTLATVPMLTIRHAQFAALQEAGFRRFADELLPLLETSAHPSIATFKTSGLMPAVTQTLDRARSYGLSGRKDVTRFFNLTAKYGLAFEDRPEYAWVRAQLADPSVTDPSRRVALVLDQIARRERIAEHNRNLREAFERRPKKSK
jgi:hypothetical protein